MALTKKKSATVILKAHYAMNGQPVEAMLFVDLSGLLRATIEAAIYRHQGIEWRIKPLREKWRLIND